VDTRGLIHEKDVEQVMKLAEAIKADFANDLARGKRVTATSIRGNSRKYKASNVNDGDPDTYWATDDNIIESSLEINFRKPTEMNRFLVQEDIRLGQRVKKFKIEALVDKNWEPVASETTIGYKRILRFPEITATKLRLTIEDAKASPVISNIGVYRAPKVLVEPVVRRNKTGVVTIEAFDSGLDIFYSLNGTPPDTSSGKYDGEFIWKEKGTVKAVAVDPASGETSPVTTSVFDVVKEKWKVAEDFASVGETANIFDGDENSAWNIDIKSPVDIVIDLGEMLFISGFNYLPDQGRWNPGIIFNFEFFVSKDGNNWGDPVFSGEFSNIKNSPIWQEKRFDPVSGRFIKLRALSTAEENGRFGIAEFGILTN
jgi:alpha-L-fucosidase